jgi:threonine dehydratase
VAELAAELTAALQPRPGTVCCIVSGGNVDPEVYRTLLAEEEGERAAPDV